MKATVRPTSAQRLALSLATGLAAFALASVRCALAPTLGLLVLARALQGAVATVVMPPAIRLAHTIPRHT